MKPDEELFNRFKVLVKDIMNTASVVQNDHDRLIEDDYLTYDDVEKEYQQFIKRIDEHKNQIDSIKNDVLFRLAKIMVRYMDNYSEAHKKLASDT
jgi:hypothetical protein